MKSPHTCWLLFLTFASFISVRLTVADGTTDPIALTFFGWSDQHVQTNGDAGHLVPAIEAMNALPGTEYPPEIGGRVAEPAFVFGCGDITEWPTHAAIAAYDKLITDRLRFPTFDVLGNHDEGGKVPSDTAKNWLIKRHGALNYTFERGGIHFVVVYSQYDENLNDPAQPLTQEALHFVQESLTQLPDRAPTILATHLCFDAMTNRDALVDTLGDANVIAILGGHYHKAKVDRYRGRSFVQLPSPAPGSPGEIMVIRVDSSHIIAIPFDYQQQRWADNPRKRLDLQLRQEELSTAK